MTDDDVTDGEGRRPLRDRPPPAWYGQGWPVKLGTTIAAVLMAVCLTLILIGGVMFVAPSLNRLSKIAESNGRTAAANTQIVRDLAHVSAVERQTGACFDRLNAVATDRNADAISAIARQNGALWALLVALSRQPRDPVQIRALIGVGGAVGARAAQAAAAYDEAASARNRWVKDGRHLPCPVAD